jgi:murein DD-endopeptidase MepM/ murein hydrolase activator NlpD
MLRKLRHLLSENLNVILIPESGAKIVSFRVRKRMAQSLATGSAVLALFLVVSVQVFVESGRRGHVLAEVGAENVALREELTQLTGAVDVLSQSLARNARYAREARALAGLHDEPEALGMGHGGPEDEAPLLGRFADPELRSITLHAEVRVDSLMRTSEQQRHEYERVLQTLRDRNETLDHLPSIYPVEGGDGWYSSGFGHRKDPFTGRRAFHAGVDISCAEGTPVVATADGVVARATRDRFFGNAVRIDHGNGIETVYAHNSENLVNKGDKVRRGQVIAKVGSTGRSTGPHLHYAVIVDGKATNPMTYILPDDIVVD